MTIRIHQHPLLPLLIFSTVTSSTVASSLPSPSLLHREPPRFSIFFVELKHTHPHTYPPTHIWSDLTWPENDRCVCINKPLTHSHSSPHSQTFFWTYSSSSFSFVSAWLPVWPHTRSKSFLLLLLFGRFYSHTPHHHHHHHHHSPSPSSPSDLLSVNMNSLFSLHPFTFSHLTLSVHTLLTVYAPADPHTSSSYS